MAEVSPYGFSADVYSFAILFWEMLTLKTAFEKYSRQRHYKEIIVEGKRPKLSRSWPFVVIKAPYNLKADVYSFSVVLWEMVGLKQPFPKCKKRIEFEQALPKLDKILAIDRRWPVPIQDIIKRGLSKDLSERPTMKEVHNTLDEFVTNGVEDSDAENSRTQRTTRRRRASSFALGGSMRKLGSSIVSSKSNRRRSDGTGSSDITIDNLIEEVSRIEQ